MTRSTAVHLIRRTMLSTLGRSTISFTSPMLVTFIGSTGTAIYSPALITTDMSMILRCFSAEEKKTIKEDDEVTITIQEPDAEYPKEMSEKREEEIDRSKFTNEVKFRMPDMAGDGKVSKWYKSEGDIIRRKDTICDIELEVRLQKLMLYLGKHFDVEYK